MPVGTCLLAFYSLPKAERMDSYKAVLALAVFKTELQDAGIVLSENMSRALNEFLEYAIAKQALLDVEYKRLLHG